MKIDKSKLEETIKITDFLTDVGILVTKGEARRLTRQRGVWINERQLKGPDDYIDIRDVKDGSISVRIGKMRIYKVGVE